MSDSSSDSEDVDYIPVNESASDASDANGSDSDKHSSGSEAEEEGGKSRKRGKRRRRKRTKAGAKSDATGENESTPPDAKAAYDKQRADELWASFVSSAKPKVDEQRKAAESAPPVLPNATDRRTNGATNLRAPNDQSTSSSLPAASAVLQSASSASTTQRTATVTGTASDESRSGAVRPSAGANGAGDESAPNATAKRKAGIDGVLAFINKKQKLNTLEKSKLDWETFKREADLNEELATFNRGKTGYLEKQSFLERTDVRVYEREREVRLKQINKRLGSGGGGGSKLD